MSNTNITARDLKRTQDEIVRLNTRERRHADAVQRNRDNARKRRALVRATDPNEKARQREYSRKSIAAKRARLKNVGIDPYKDDTTRRTLRSLVKRLTEIPKSCICHVCKKFKPNSGQWCNTSRGFICRSCNLRKP